jgi:DNA primase
MNKKEARKILHNVLGNFAQRGSELLFTCPACEHHKLKFSVNLDKNVYKCWVCDFYGRNIRRIVRRFGTYIQLQKWDSFTDTSDLAKFEDLFLGKNKQENEIELELPSEFQSLANKTLPVTAKPALNYLHERGVTKEDIIRWKIGYCFSGEYENRIIIPSFGEKGKLNYFIARTYNGGRFKYKNPQASKNVVFNELFVDWNKDLVLVEGVFDAINAGNAVPILGSTLRANSKLIREIVLNDTPIYIALDPDVIDKERKIIQTLLEYDIELYKIDVSGYEDVGEMSKDAFEERKRKAVFIDRDNYLLLNLLSAI